MNIQEIGKILQKHKTLSPEVLVNTLSSLHEVVNNDELTPLKILSVNEQRDSALFVLGANAQTIKKITQIKNSDVIYPYLLCSFLLAKICQHTVFEKDCINDIATIIMNQVPKETGGYNHNSYSYQNTSKNILHLLSFDVGFTIAHCLYHGIDCTDLVKVYKPTLITDEKKFITGFIAGFNSESKGLMFNESYIKNLGQLWITNNNHKNMIIKIFQHNSLLTPTLEPKFNPTNVRTTWILNILLPESKLIADIHNQQTDGTQKYHENKLHDPEFAAYFEQCLIEKGKKIADQLEQKFANKLASEIARIEKKAIDRAQQTLIEQTKFNENILIEEKSLAFKRKLNKML